MKTLQRWLCTWEALGATRTNELEQLYHSLILRYQEPHRRYHTDQHLFDCLERVAEFQSIAEHFAEVELALWFHDAIYDKKGSKNEIQSANWARDSMLAAGLSLASADRVHALIMCTRHNAQANGIDAEIVTDVDLGILGAPPENFALYERQIREEYSWVPALLFRHKRKAILEEFLRRPRIYSTELYYQRFDAQARSNLSHALVQLRGPLLRAWHRLAIK